MGTPGFAVPSLEKIVDAGYNVVGVVTAPDKPAGRGMKMTESDIKKFALAKNLKNLQPEKLKNEAFLAELTSLNADMQVVVAFRMLPEVVWNMPPMGTINLHGSLLPQYRGAAPINWAIINGEEETGVTTFKLKHKIDTGDILLQEKMKIGEAETAGELHDRMKIIGANLLLKTINGLAEGRLSETCQSSLSSPENETNLHHAPKISTETCEINWNKNATDIYNLVRGLSPYPAAFTWLKGKKLKIINAEKEITNANDTPGEHITDNKSYLKFACKNGYIVVTELQLEGKKKMNVKDFLRGWRS